MTLDQFKVLIAAALSDGDLQDEERAMLDRAGVFFHLRPADLNLLIRQMRHTGFRKDLPPGERDALFQVAVRVILADGQMREDEFAFLHRLGTAFGLSPEEVTRSISAREPGP